MALGPGCPNMLPSANLTVSRQTGDDCATALLSPTIAPGLAPAGPAIF